MVKYNSEKVSTKLIITSEIGGGVCSEFIPQIPGIDLRTTVPKMLCSSSATSWPNHVISSEQNNREKWNTSYASGYGEVATRASNISPQK